MTGPRLPYPKRPRGRPRKEPAAATPGAAGVPDRGAPAYTPLAARPGPLDLLDRAMDLRAGMTLHAAASALGWPRACLLDMLQAKGWTAYYQPPAGPAEIRVTNAGKPLIDQPVTWITTKTRVKVPAFGTPRLTDDGAAAVGAAFVAYAAALRALWATMAPPALPGKPGGA